MMTPIAPTAPKRSVPLLFVTLIALIPAMSGNMRGLLAPSLKLSDILAIVLLLLILLVWHGRWRLFDGLGVSVAIYALVYAALTIVNFDSRAGDLPLSDLPKELLGVPQYVLLYFLAYAIGQRSADIWDWLKPSLVIACGMASITILQMLDVGSVRTFLSWFTGNEQVAEPLAWQVYRGSGLFPSWHALGMYLCVHLVLAIALLAKGKVARGQQFLLVSSIVLCGVGILTTSTATPIVIAALGVLAFALTGRRLGVVLLLIVASLAAISFTPLGTELAARIGQQSTGSGFIPQSFLFRMDVWQRDFIPIINAHPFTGYGPVSERDGNLFDYMESMYITLLMSGGMLLLAAFVIFYATALGRMKRVSRMEDRPSLRAAANAMRYMLWMLLFAMIIHPYLNDAGAAPMIFIALGIVSGLGYQSEKPVDAPLVRHDLGRALVAR